MDNQTRILECALNLFSSRGYEAVGVQEIVETAGVTKPTLYHYFNSKHGLLDHLLEMNFTPLILKIREAAHYNGIILLTLENTVKVYFAYAQENPAFYRLQLSMYFSSPDSEPNQAVAPYGLQQYQILEQLFLDATKDHGNMRGRHNLYAVTFLGMINSYIGLYLNSQVELNDKLVYQAVHQFMHGIFS